MRLKLLIETNQTQQHLKTLLRLLRSDRLGKVYSIGADQGKGRYEHYVQESEEQAWMHKGRWQTVQKVSSDYEDLVTEQLAEAFQVVIDGEGESEFRIYVDEALELLLDVMQKYPPPPPGSRYIRTDTLKRSWRKKLSI